MKRILLVCVCVVGALVWWRSCAQVREAVSFEIEREAKLKNVIER